MSENILFLGNKIFEIPPFFQTRLGDLGEKVHACSLRFSALNLRRPSLPFDSLPYPTRTIRRRVRSVNHVTTKGKEVDHNLWVWGSIPRARAPLIILSNTREN